MILTSAGWMIASMRFKELRRDFIDIGKVLFWQGLVRD